MSNKRTTIKWIIVGVAVAVIAIVGFKYWRMKQSELPEGIVSGNGRIEAKLVDIAAREPLRVKEMLVDEGALVTPGQVLARLDTVTLDAELLEANEQVMAAEERLAVAKASIAKQKSEINLARIEADRSRKLVQEGAGSQRELDARNTKLGTTSAALAETEAMLKTAEKQVAVARSAAATIQTRIDDATLTSPVTGRVLYRLAEAGEVVAAGGKVLTLVNLADVYMEIFLPSEEAASVKLVHADPTGAVGRRRVEAAAGGRCVGGARGAAELWPRFPPRRGAPGAGSGGRRDDLSGRHGRAIRARRQRHRAARPRVGLADGGAAGQHGPDRGALCVQPDLRERVLDRAERARVAAAADPRDP